MIVFIMILLILVPLFLGAEAIFLRKKQPKISKLFAGISIGVLLGNGVNYFKVFPRISIIMLSILIIISTIIFILDKSGKKSILKVSLISFLSFIFIWNGIFDAYLNRDVKYEYKNSSLKDSTAKVAYIYHPGVSSFQDIVREEISTGLEDSGYSVDYWTIGKSAPLTVDEYDLLIVSCPTYDWSPSKLMKKYINRCENFNKIPTVAIITAAGYSVRSEPELVKLLENRGAKVIESKSFYTTAPLSEQFDEKYKGFTKREIINDFSKKIVSRFNSYE